mmetsp:Transcript_86078/g.238508  ORF Transcript_86078/g.238508 Transcript_86078/m.238508 type:complete len:292 (-) Transcript_86078:290-1165(-)
MVESALLRVIQGVHVNLLFLRHQVLHHGLVGEGGCIHQSGHSSHVAAVQIWLVWVTAHKPGHHAAVALYELLHGRHVPGHCRLQQALHLQVLGHELDARVELAGFRHLANQERPFLRRYADPALHTEALDGARGHLCTALVDGAKLQDGDDGAGLQNGFGLAVEGLRHADGDLGLHLVLRADLEVAKERLHVHAAFRHEELGWSGPEANPTFSLAGGNLDPRPLPHLQDLEGGADSKLFQGLAVGAILFLQHQGYGRLAMVANHEFDLWLGIEGHAIQGCREPPLHCLSCA